MIVVTGYGNNPEMEKLVLPAGQMSLSDTSQNRRSPASASKTKSAKTCDYWNKCLRFFDSLSVSGEMLMA